MRILRRGRIEEFPASSDCGAAAESECGAATAPAITPLVVARKFLRVGESGSDMFAM
jgi:hypothetical protein